MTKPFYITTPIYYVNGRPHIGHAYTTIAADTITRWHRLKGERSFFLTGTDEHGQKVLEKAQERGMTPKVHADDMVVHWRAMMEQLGIRYDRFFRTTDDDHIAVVQAVLQKLFDEGLIYQDTYEGWYSKGAERFWTEKDLVDGKCPDTGGPVEKITETNYFFKMSQYGDALMAHIEANPDFVQPVARRNEVIGFLNKGLGDLCISRPKTRMGWGIEIPFDRDYVTYVWFDALLNYLTGIGYHPTEPKGDWQAFWPADFHLIGKDILTTHAVYWSTMLMAIGVDLPKTFFAHGWWRAADGQKMSKSLGNTIDVDALIEGYGLDATRYFFLREIRFGADGSFSYDGFMTRYNADLANDLGNLAHRGLSMSTNWLGGVVPAAVPTEAEHELAALATEVVADFDAHLCAMRFDQALERCFELVGAGNKYVDTQAPWALNKKGDMERLATVLRTVLEVSYVAGVLLSAVMPAKMDELLQKLGMGERTAAEQYAQLTSAPSLAALTDGAAVEVGDPLFPRHKKHPEAVEKLLAAAAPPAEEPQRKPKPDKQKKKSKLEKAEEDTGPITYDDFTKVKLRTGKVLSAEAHPNADKLLVLKVDVGEPEPRTIVAGLASRFSPDEVVGRNVVVVVNLAPAKLRGVVSQGMLLAAGGKEVIDLVGVDAAPGEIVR